MPEIPLGVCLPKPGESRGLGLLFLAFCEVTPQSVDHALVRRLDQLLSAFWPIELIDMPFNGLARLVKQAFVKCNFYAHFWG